MTGVATRGGSTYGTMDSYRLLGANLYPSVLPI